MHSRDANAVASPFGPLLPAISRYLSFVLLVLWRCVAGAEERLALGLRVLNARQSTLAALLVMQSVQKTRDETDAVGSAGREDAERGEREKGLSIQEAARLERMMGASGLCCAGFGLRLIEPISACSRYHHQLRRPAGLRGVLTSKGMRFADPIQNDLRAFFFTFLHVSAQVEMRRREHLDPGWTFLRWHIK